MELINTFVFVKLKMGWEPAKSWEQDFRMVGGFDLGSSEWAMFEGKYDMKEEFEIEAKKVFGDKAIIQRIELID